jgi:hypothetical protein
MAALGQRSDKEWRHGAVRNYFALYPIFELQWRLYLKGCLRKRISSNFKLFHVKKFGWAENKHGKPQSGWVVFFGNSVFDAVRAIATWSKNRRKWDKRSLCGPCRYVLSTTLKQRGDTVSHKGVIVESSWAGRRWQCIIYSDVWTDVTVV